MKVLLASVALTIRRVPEEVHTEAVTLDLESIKDGKIDVHDPETGKTHRCTLDGWTTEYIEDQEL